MTGIKKMKINWYILHAGKLLAQPSLDGWPKKGLGKLAENWFDVEASSPEELSSFLAPLGMHPLQLKRCLDAIDDPGVVSFGKVLLMEYPAAFDPGADTPAYLTILLKEPELVTIRHGAVPALDELTHDLTSENAPALHHLPQIIYLILDQFADLNVEAQIDTRDRILIMAKTLAKDPGSVRAGDLSQLRWQVNKLVSLIENQLYCISGLSASDNIALQEPHRKAYIQDLVSEAEIAQRGVYRLEARVNDLYNDFQMAGSDRVEKRLRFLTIVSVITLPLGLIAGLLGMNVGGLPGTTSGFSFAIVIVIMVIIIVIQYLYFKRSGWFD
jgi:zinc transporter